MAELSTSAADFLKRKKLTPGFDYRDVWQQEHDISFTVAKAMRLDILSELHEGLIDAVEQGQTLQQFKKQITPTLVDKGWWGVKDAVDPVTGETREVQLGSPRRLKTIYRTNMRTARAAGQWGRIDRNRKTHPYLLYELGPNREHREQHQQWAGTILPADDPWWGTHYPPNGFGCKCRVRQISRGEYERRKGSGRYLTQAPKVEYQPWENKRTGEIEQVPIGVHPAFAYHIGKSGARAKALKKITANKKAILETTFKTSLKKGIVPPVFTTVPSVTTEGIEAVLHNIPNGKPQVEKLKAFLKAKGTKSIFIKTNQMSAGTKASWAIEKDVLRYLGDDAKRSIGIYYYGQKKRRGRQLPLGFTNPDFNHVNVRLDTRLSKAKLNDKDKQRVAAKSTADAVRKAVDNPDTFTITDLTTTAETEIITIWAHELGHQVHYWAESPTTPFKTSITRYGDYNKNEWHAEHFVAWLFNRSALDKDIASYFDDLIETATTSETKKR